MKRLRPIGAVQPILFFALLVGAYTYICILVYRTNRDLQTPDYHSTQAGKSSFTEVRGDFKSHYEGEIIDFSIHPIDDLRAEADVEFEQSTRNQTRGVKEAAAAYRGRRGRHPPPGFDHWVRWAEDHGAIMLESMFDNIYEDLEPFWGVPPSTTRSQAASWPLVLSIRGGVVYRRSKLSDGASDFVQAWQDLLWEVPGIHLPDVDLAINPDEEPHVFVPQQVMKRYMDAANTSRHLIPPSTDFPINDVFASYSYGRLEDIPTFQGFHAAPPTKSIWELTRYACGPSSPAWNHHQDIDFSLNPLTRFPSSHQDYTYNGFISNWTAANSACTNPALRNLHGYFVGTKPISAALGRNITSKVTVDPLLTQRLFPLISSSKLTGVSNEILLPSPMDLADPPDEDLYEDYEESIDSYGRRVFSLPNISEPAWSDKIPKLLFRGPATGGVPTNTSWTRFHLHRLVSMLNATQISIYENMRGAPLVKNVPGGKPEMPWNFPLPDQEIFPLGATQWTRDLGLWVSGLVDAGFTDLNCDSTAEPEPETEAAADTSAVDEVNITDAEADPGYGSLAKRRIRRRPIRPAAKQKHKQKPKDQDDRIPCTALTPFYHTLKELPTYKTLKYKYHLHPDMSTQQHYRSQHTTSPPSPSFLQSLRSNSAPIHTTITTSWLATRLKPWTHFIPLTPQHLELYSLLEFFMGYTPSFRAKGLGAVARKGSDRAGEEIGARGREWAQKVLRREDMVLYTWRVVLEYARVTAEGREQMGFVADLEGGWREVVRGVEAVFDHSREGMRHRGRKDERD